MTKHTPTDWSIRLAAVAELLSDIAKRPLTRAQMDEGAESVLELICFTNSSDGPQKGTVPG